MNVDVRMDIMQILTDYIKRSAKTGVSDMW
jgi:hypothetical protein